MKRTRMRGQFFDDTGKSNCIVHEHAHRVEAAGQRDRFRRCRCGSCSKGVALRIYRLKDARSCNSSC